MFSAIFQHHVGYLVVCTSAALVLGGAAWALARGLGRPHGIWWSALAFTVTGVLGVTFMGAGPASGACVLNHQLSEPFHTTQGVWNLAMMVPFGAFAVLAVRRPLPVLVGVIALPLAIEFAQATVDGLGRVCDSSDAEMNIIGGVAGFAVAVAVLAVRRSVDWQRGVKGAVIASVALVLLGTGVAKPMLSFTNVDGTGLSSASADQKRAVEAAVEEAFGDRYTIGQLYEQPCGETSCRHVVFSLHSREKGHSQEFAEASLSWPDKKHLNVLLEDSDRLTAMGYPVQGTRTPTTEGEAQEVAQAYAQQRYPWAKGATRQKTTAVGEKADLGWMTSWRWTYNGVLMPRMLDVQIDRGGRVSQIDVTLGATRADFPKLELDARQATKAVDRAMAAKLRANGSTDAEFKSQAVTLKADDFDGTLKPYWLVNVTSYRSGADADAQEPDPVDTYRVNAMSGQVYDAGGVPLKAG
ncbi:VanZ family protein [Streptomyces sp. GMY01]|uniref:VanZ family protein n=1 Tax=Streptomyces sp. GMY02 TaxID=1333528 RepID=UPI00146F6ED4|nr:VanZ family protein [Streptomyces sp. GMY02]NMO38178.1 VanZ family protein [Streptomyces sp. GMY02]